MVSLPADGVRFSSAVRQHWGVENGLHWVLERTFAWLGRNRRHSKDYEHHTASSESMLRVSAIHLMLQSLKPSNVYPPFRYRATG